jgi:predicted nucleic acid-binding protein
VYLLDSNIISYYVYESGRYPLLTINFRATRPSDRWISIVTAEELITGRIEVLQSFHRVTRQELLNACYYLRDTFAVIHSYHNLIKEFTEDAYQQLRGMPGDASSNDRLIAAIALANNFTLVTHDRDFQAIKDAKPDLTIQKWCEEDYSAVNSAKTPPAQASP